MMWSSSGALAGWAVVDAVVVVVTAAAVVVVFGFVLVEVDAADDVLPRSTCCSNTMPMTTARPINNTPLAAAKPAPRATSLPDEPDEGRFMRSFCPVGPLRGAHRLRGLAR